MRQVSEGNLCWVSLPLSLSAVFLERIPLWQKGGKTATIEEKITCEKSQVVLVLNANDCGKGRVLAVAAASFKPEKGRRRETRIQPGGG